MITHAQLKTEHHWPDDDSLRGTLAVTEPTDGLLLYRNLMVDSSLFGQQHLVLCGPTRTIPSASEAPTEINPFNTGPSGFEQFIGEVDVEDLRRGLE